MKRIFLILLLFSNTLLPGIPVKKNLELPEENKLFRDSVLNENSVKNANLLYASFVAYKDRLNDLSLETFYECKAANSNNRTIICVCEYYIGKNLFYIGKYQDAIKQFLIVEQCDLAKYDYLKVASSLSAAISYYRLGDNKNFKKFIQKVIKEDIKGNYKKTALEILESVK